jgi:hypothetical protein
MALYFYLGAGAIFSVTLGVVIATMIANSRVTAALGLVADLNTRLSKLGALLGQLESENYALKRAAQPRDKTTGKMLPKQPTRPL